MCARIRSTLVGVICHDIYNTKTVNQNLHSSTCFLNNPLLPYHISPDDSEYLATVRTEHWCISTTRHVAYSVRYTKSYIGYCRVNHHCMVIHPAITNVWFCASNSLLPALYHWKYESYFKIPFHSYRFEKKYFLNRTLGIKSSFIGIISPDKFVKRNIDNWYILSYMSEKDSLFPKGRVGCDIKGQIWYAYVVNHEREMWRGIFEGCW